MHQARRVKPGMVDRQIKRDFPAQIKPHRVHRPLVRQPLAEGEQQNLGQQARRDRRTTVIRRVTLGEVLITHDLLAVLSQQRVDRPISQQARAPRRIKETLLPFHHPEHRHLAETVNMPICSPNDMRQSGRNNTKTVTTFSAVSSSRSSGVVVTPPGVDQRRGAIGDLTG